MNDVIPNLIRNLKLLFMRLLSRRVHFSKAYAGKILSIEDGKKFQVIRDLRVNPKQSPKKPVAVFKVRFKFSGLPLGVNKRLSMIPAPFLMAKPGFCEKIWTVIFRAFISGQKRNLLKHIPTLSFSI